MEKTEKMDNLVADYSASFVSSRGPIAIIMAAGHGKRGKGPRSKILHQIWGVPTVIRVSQAAKAGLLCADQIIVVGQKAEEVVKAMDRAPGRRYVLQFEQKGTGHAVKTAIESIPPEDQDRDIYVFPGDKGLLEPGTIRLMKETFEKGKSNMAVLVSAFSGSVEENPHDRILRVPAKDARGQEVPAAEAGKIIQVLEYREITRLKEQPYRVTHRGMEFAFTKEELLQNREFNAGLYAFRDGILGDFLAKLKGESVQGEMNLTDLIYLFNQAGLTVEAVAAPDDETVLGFNDKSVLQRMESVARKKVFSRLKKIVTIQDKDNFFLADEAVAQILDMDREGIAPDIYIGEGAWIGPGVSLSPRIYVEKNARLQGNIHLGAGVFIGESALLSTFEHQHMTIGDNTEILQRNLIKGNVSIGKNCRIETVVRITGSDDSPARVGNNVTLKGTTYLYGCVLEDGVYVQNCHLVKNRIRKAKDKSGKPVRVAHILPKPEGMECVEELK